MASLQVTGTLCSFRLLPADWRSLGCASEIRALMQAVFWLQWQGRCEWTNTGLAKDYTVSLIITTIIKPCYCPQISDKQEGHNDANKEHVWISLFYCLFYIRLCLICVTQSKMSQVSKCVFVCQHIWKLSINPLISVNNYDKMKQYF